jgi:hypothetical protein
LEKVESRATAAAFDQSQTESQSPIDISCPQDTPYLRVHGRCNRVPQERREDSFFVRGRSCDYVRIASARLRSWDGPRQNISLIHLCQTAMHARRRNKSHKVCDHRHASQTLLTIHSRSPMSSYGQLNPPLRSTPSDQMADPIGRPTARPTWYDTLRQMVSQRTRSWTRVRGHSRG